MPPLKRRRTQGKLNGPKRTERLRVKNWLLILHLSLKREGMSQLNTTGKPSQRQWKQ